MFPLSPSPVRPLQQASLPTYSTPSTPAGIRAYFLALFPADELPGAFLEVASQSLLHGIASYYAAGLANRPDCTLQNVVATLSYPNIEHVINMVASDPTSALWIAHLREALSQQAIYQVQATLAFATHVLEHVQPSSLTILHIHSFISSSWLNKPVAQACLHTFASR